MQLPIPHTQLILRVFMKIEPNIVTNKKVQKKTYWVPFCAVKLGAKLAPFKLQHFLRVKIALIHSAKITLFERQFNIGQK